MSTSDGCAVCKKDFKRGKGSQSYCRKSLKTKIDDDTEVIDVIQKILEQPVCLDKASNFVCDLCFTNMRSWHRHCVGLKKAEKTFYNVLKPDSPVLHFGAPRQTPWKRKFMMSTPTTSGRAKARRFTTPSSTPKVVKYQHSNVLTQLTLHITSSRKTLLPVNINGYCYSYIFTH